MVKTWDKMDGTKILKMAIMQIKVTAEIRSTTNIQMANTTLTHNTMAANNNLSTRNIHQQVISLKPPKKLSRQNRHPTTLLTNFENYIF